MEKFNKLTDDMNNHALRDYPREAVGIITKDFKYVPCKNISDTPMTNFILDPAALS
jgi:proteasome lid subunit RPN8/RPN11